MSDKQAFWDSSALIPLFIGQPHSQKARLTLRKHPKPVVAWTASLEAVNALARLHRSALLSLSGRERAITSLDSLNRRGLEITPSHRLRELARHILLQYELRAADAAQLASALVWTKEHPRRPFVCFDSRLAHAAELAGSEVIAS